MAFSPGSASLLSRRSFVRQAGLLAGARRLGGGGPPRGSAERAAARPWNRRCRSCRRPRPGGLPRCAGPRPHERAARCSRWAPRPAAAFRRRRCELINTALDREGVTAISTSQGYNNALAGRVGLARVSAQDVFLSTKCSPTTSPTRKSRWPSRSSC